METRGQKMGKRVERERQQARKYRATKEAMRATRAERIRTMEMLLDAKWMGDVFRQVQMCGGHPVVCYFNEKGEVVNFKERYG